MPDCIFFSNLEDVQHGDPHIRNLQHEEMNTQMCVWLHVCVCFINSICVCILEHLMHFQPKVKHHFCILTNEFRCFLFIRVLKLHNVLCEHEFIHFSLFGEDALFDGCFQLLHSEHTREIWLIRMPQQATICRKAPEPRKDAPNTPLDDSIQDRKLCDLHAGQSQPRLTQCSLIRFFLRLYIDAQFWTMSMPSLRTNRRKSIRLTEHPRNFQNVHVGERASLSWFPQIVPNTARAICPRGRDWSSSPSTQVAMRPYPCCYSKVCQRLFSQKCTLVRFRLYRHRLLQVKIFLQHFWDIQYTK